MVFAKYNMENMNGFEIAKSSKEKLENNVPIFNMIIDNNVKEEEIDKVYDMIGNKLNSLITEPISNNIVNIITDYKEYKNSTYTKTTTRKRNKGNNRISTKIKRDKPKTKTRAYLYNQQLNFT